MKSKELIRKSAVGSVIIVATVLAVVFLLETFFPSLISKELGWQFYALTAAVTLPLSFLSLMDSLDERKRSGRNQFIRHLLTAVLLLACAAGSLLSADSFRDWFLAILFSVCLFMEISSAARAFRTMKAGTEGAASDSTE